MSKGSWKRPVQVSHETYSRNYDRIFGKGRITAEVELEDGTKVKAHVNPKDMRRLKMQQAEEDGAPTEEVR